MSTAAAENPAASEPVSVSGASHGAVAGGDHSAGDASFDLENPLAESASATRGEYSETVQRLLANIKRENLKRENSAGAVPARGEGANAVHQNGLHEETEMTTFRSSLAGAPLPRACDSASLDAAQNLCTNDRNEDIGRNIFDPSAPDGQSAATVTATHAAGELEDKIHGPCAGGPKEDEPEEGCATEVALPAAAVPAQAVPSREATFDEAERAAALPATSPPPPAAAAPQRAAPPAHPHPPELALSPSKPMMQSAAAAAAALRHPEEELLKPARWDTHSWLPLVPASGLLCHQGHDVLGFQIPASQRQQLIGWSEGYMETVAQQRVRWMSFLGSHTGVLDTTMRHKIKLLMRLGVPPELRHRVWRLTTGSFAKQVRACVCAVVIGSCALQNTRIPRH